MATDRPAIEIALGSRKILAQIHRTDRRVFRIQVDPDGNVTVTAPADATPKEISDRVSRKKVWVFRQLDEIASRPPITPERRFVSGETHLFLGRQYRLAIEHSDDPHVRIDGSRLIVAARNVDDQAHCRRLIAIFHASQARSVFRERLDIVMPPFARKGLGKPSLIIRKLSKRWGSFTPKGRVVLNVDLIRASPVLIDYVICHELVHAFHPDHGTEWRALFDAVMPDWPIRKAALEAALR